jgi:predicted negative regulator of RcsB-dependent stress response
MRATERHQLKHDKFAETAQETFSWMTHHRVRLIIWITAVAAIVIVILGGWYYQQQHEELAGTDLGAALRTFNAPIRPAGVNPEPNFESYASDTERAQAGEKKFRAIADRYPHTHAGKVARYFTGVSEMQAGDNAAAEKDLRQIVDKGDAELASLAKMALASIDRATHRDDQAMAIYKGLIDHPTHSVSKPMAQLELAGLYQQTQPQEALKIYQQMRQDDPTGVAGEVAASRIAALSH